MNRPLLVFAVSLMAGVTVSALTDGYLVVSLSVVAAAIFSACFFIYGRDYRFIALGLLLFYSLGVFEYRIVEEGNMARYRDFSGKSAVIRGTVVSEPDIREARVSYIIRTGTITIDNKTTRVDGKILLSTPRSEGSPLYGYGREIEIKGQLNVPQGMKNPGGFDYRRYLAGNGMSAVVFAVKDHIVQGGMAGGNFAVRLGFTLRSKLVDVINRSLPPQQAGLLNGMLIGYREGLSREVEDAFSDAGLSHIMVVSGANILFLVMPLLFLFKRLRIGQKTANITTILVVLLYTTITGFSPNVMRAAIMAVVVLAGQLLRRESEVLTSLSLAAVLLLVYNPYTLFDIGFQLSFAATLSIILFQKNIRKWSGIRWMPGFLADIVAVTLAVQIGVIPITVFYFNKVSVISLFSNLLAVPILQVITILGSAMALLGQISVWISQALGYVNSPFLSFVLLVSRLSSELPFAVVKIPTPPLWGIAVYYGAVLFFFWYRPLKGIKLKPVFYPAACGAVLLMLLVYSLIPKELEVYFIDVGQGDSALVRTYSGKTVLIDGGGDNNPDSVSNIGETVVMPFLLDQGITRLDLVVATHGHDDHIEGLEPILKEFAIGAFVIPELDSNKEFARLVEISSERAINVVGCGKGDVIRLDDKTFFNVLNPGPDMDEPYTTLNNSSIVLKLNYMDSSVLFAADIEEETENLLADGGADLAADVLKVAHHGSSTSTTAAFLKEVKPGAAVISVGKNNFGHPSQRVLEDLKTQNARVFRTDLDGAVILKSDGKNIRIETTIRADK